MGSLQTSGRRSVLCGKIDDGRTTARDGHRTSLPAVEICQSVARAATVHGRSSKGALTEPPLGPSVRFS